MSDCKHGCGGCAGPCALCREAAAIMAAEFAALRADVARLQADLTRAIRYVGGDDIEDVMEALRKGANDAINHETTARLLTEAQAERDEAHDRIDTLKLRHEADEAYRQRAEQDLAAERTMADGAKRAWTLRAAALHEEVRRLRAVVEAGRIIYAKACHMSECYERCNCGLDGLSAALAALDEGGSDG